MTATSLASLRTEQPQSRQVTPAASFNAFLQKNKNQLALALPKHLNADRMCRLALTAFSQNRQLAQCDQKSIFASIVLASQVGLEIGVSGQGYLVPYKGKAQFVPGWQGLVDLVSRSGRATVWTGAVFQGDEFDYALGDAPYIKHRPAGEDDPRLMTHAYAVGRVNGSQWPVIEVWPIARVWRHRDRNNKVGNQHYSFGNQEMYARKLPLLQVIKYMPKSVELTNAMALDHAAEHGSSAVFEGEMVVLNENESQEAETVDQNTGNGQQQDAGADQQQSSQPSQDQAAGLIME